MFPFLYALLLLPSPHTASASSAPGTLNFYDDWDCNHPSTLSPTVSLPLSTCLQIINGYGVAIGAYPPCPSSTANLIFYQDPICGVTTRVSTALLSDSCFQLAAGIGLFDARSLMFACAPAADHPLPSSTSTVVVSQLAGVATGSAGDGGSGSTTSAGSGSVSTTSAGSGSVSTTSAGSGGVSTMSTAAAPPAQTSSGNSTGSGSGSGSSGGNTSTSDRSSGLSTSDIVAIAVGLGVGVPTMAIMLLVWLFPDFRHKVRRWISDWLDHVSIPRQRQPRWTHAATQQVSQGHGFPDRLSRSHGYGGQAPYNPVQSH
ncbi:hypothetical protein MMC30_000488 [Trapelia coarctata]|nr:hypothetical protein [Trapelia coarctata]